MFGTETNTGTAFVVIDVINPCEHQDVHLLLRSVREVLPAVRDLIERTREAGIEVIYATTTTAGGAPTPRNCSKPRSTDRTATS
jgi:nicotinamidase-related amidase